MKFPRVRSVILKNSLLFGLITLFCCVIRLPYLASDVLGNHTFRQSDTLAMIHRMASGESSILFPRFYAVANYLNTQRLYLAEFPLYEILTAFVVSILGESLLLLRLISVFLTGVISYCVFLISKRFFSLPYQFLSVVVLNFFPVFYFWGQGISPDLFGLTAFCLSLVFLVSTKLEDKNDVRFAASSLLFGLAILTKPFYFAFIIFHFWYFFSKLKPRSKSLFYLIAFYLLPVMLYGLWKAWVDHFPSYTKDPTATSLMHSDKGWWNYWINNNFFTVILKERLLGKLFTPLGGIFSMLGVFYIWFASTQKHFVASYLTASAVILVIISSGSLRHDYYMLHLFPISAIVCTKGIELTIKWCKKRFSSGIHIDQFSYQFVVLLLLPIFVYFYGVREFYAQTQILFGIDELQAPQKDYAVLRTVIPPKEKVLLVNDFYNPTPLNMLQREGFVYTLFIPPGVNPTCLTPDIFEKKIKMFRDLGTKYLLIPKQIADSYFLCQSEPLLKHLATSNEMTRVIGGDTFWLYKFVPSGR